MKSYGPIVVLALDWILQWLSLRVALNTGVVRPNEIQFCRIDNIRPAGIGSVVASRPVTAFTTDVPFLHTLCFDVVVDGMATITQRPRRAFSIVGRIEWHPPIGVGLHEVWTPEFMIHIPLRTQREVIIPDLLEISLLPFGAVD